MSFLTDIDLTKPLPEYKLVLCKLSEERMMTLNHYTELEYKAHFISIDELSFKIPFYRTGINGEQVENERYNAVKGDMLLLLNETKYFYIHYAKEVVSETGEIYKEVQAFSREYELSQKKVVGYSAPSRMLYDVNNVRDRLPTDKPGEPNSGLFQGFMNYVHTISSWRIRTIEPNLMQTRRALDFNDTNLLKAFQDVQAAFECVFKFDTKTKQIDIFQLERMGSDRGFRISDKNFLKSLEKTIKSDEIKTRLYLYGKAGVSIQSLNLVGKPYIDDLRFYKTTDYMSEALITALNNYENAKSAPVYQNQFALYLDKLNTDTALLGAADDQLTALITQKKILSEQLDILITSKNPHLPPAEMAISDAAIAGKRVAERAKEDQIEAQRNDMRIIRERMAVTRESVTQLGEDLDIANFISAPLLSELDSFIREETYKDEEYEDHSIDLLLEKGERMLNKISQPAIQFSVNVVDFLSLVEAQHTWPIFVLGDKVKLFHKELNFDYLVNLVGYVHKPVSKELTLNFSTGAAMDDDSIYLRDLLDELKNTSTAVDFSKYKWDKAERAETEITKYIDGNLNLAKQALILAENQEIAMDERGYWGTKVDPVTGVKSPYQLRMTNDLIAMTKNDWEDIDVAISPEYGINATMLNGKIGNFAYINADQVRAGMLISADSSTWINLDDGSFNFKNSLTWDPVAKELLVLDGKITGGSLDIGNGTFTVSETGAVTASDMTIVGGQLNINNLFTVDRDGKVVASDITIDGGQFNINDVFVVDSDGRVTASDIRIEGGELNINDVFIVDKWGAVTASDMNILGGELNINDLFSVDRDGGVIASNITILGGMLDINGMFLVDEDGKVTASDITITGGELNINDTFTVDVEGNCTAKSFTLLNEEHSTAVLDEYGIDPRFVKGFKNFVYNSSFERFDAMTKKPHYWTGGKFTSQSSFDETGSLELAPGEMTEQEKGDSNTFMPRVDPEWWGSTQGRVSFMKKGGPIQVQLFHEADFSPLVLTNEEGESSTAYNTGSSDNWQHGRYTFSFVVAKPGRIWMRFTSMSSSPLWLDAVQLEPDFNKKYPSFYSHGPYSRGPSDGAMSNTWFEYINIPYQSSVAVVFNKQYSAPPTVNVSLMRNLNAVNAGASFGNINASANVDLTIANVEGQMVYTGCVITWGGSPSGSNLFASIQIIGRA